jgi:hypothetical protein
MKLVATRPNHRPSHFMKSAPCRLAASKSKHSLETQSVSTEFLAGNVPNGLEPQPQRFSRSVECPPSKDRCLLFAFGTTDQSFRHLPTFCFIAPRTSETIRPAKLLKIFQAILFSRKPLIKFLHGLRVIHTPPTGYGSSWLMASLYHKANEMDSLFMCFGNIHSALRLIKSTQSEYCQSGRGCAILYK